MSYNSHMFTWHNLSSSPSGVTYHITLVCPYFLSVPSLIKLLNSTVMPQKNLSGTTRVSDQCYSKNTTWNISMSSPKDFIVWSTARLKNTRWLIMVQVWGTKAAFVDFFPINILILRNDMLLFSNHVDIYSHPMCYLYEATFAWQQIKYSWGVIHLYAYKTRKNVHWWWNDYVIALRVVWLHVLSN